MSIIITAQGTDLTSELDPRFGRARYFLKVDPETGSAEAHDNVQNLNAPQGAGIQAARTVAELGAEAIITGHLGPNAFRTLAAAGLRAYMFPGQGTAAEALEAYRQGRLQELQAPDVPGHWM